MGESWKVANPNYGCLNYHWSLFSNTKSSKCNEDLMFENNDWNKHLSTIDVPCPFGTNMSKSFFF
jgi:hypothetical protein